MAKNDIIEFPRDTPPEHESTVPGTWQPAAHHSGAMVTRQHGYYAMVRCPKCGGTTRVGHIEKKKLRTNRGPAPNSTIMKDGTVHSKFLCRAGGEAVERKNVRPTKTNKAGIVKKMHYPCGYNATIRLSGWPEFVADRSVLDKQRRRDELDRAKAERAKDDSYEDDLKAMRAERTETRTKVVRLPRVG